jgi:hypothetical protein
MDSGVSNTYVICTEQEVRNIEIKGKLNSEDACYAFFTKLKKKSLYQQIRPSVRDKGLATVQCVCKIFMTVVYTRCLLFVRFMKFGSVRFILYLTLILLMRRIG